MKICHVENDLVAYKYRILCSKLVKKSMAIIAPDIEVIFVHPDDFEGFVEKAKELLEVISKGLKGCNN